MSGVRLQAELMAIIDATVAHLQEQYDPGTILLYKMITLHWYDQERQPSWKGLSWRLLPDGRRQCMLGGMPCIAYSTGAPLTLEELGV